MPPKIAKKLTAAQTQRVGESQDNQENAVQPDQETQVDDATQPDQDTQVEDNTQPDADVPTSSADSNAVNDVVNSTADGADAATPDTPASSTHEVETKAVIKTATKKPAGKKVAAAAGKTVDGTKKKRRRKYDPTNFKAYIFKVQKQVNPEGGIGKTAMQILNDFIKDICTRIADLASDLCKKLKKPTLQAHDIQTATKLILGGQLAKHAQSEGSKALHRFNKATDKGLR